MHSAGTRVRVRVRARECERTVEHRVADGVGHSREARVEAQRGVVRVGHTARQVHRALVGERVRRHRVARLR